MDLDGILKGCIKIYLIKRAAINAKSKDLKDHVMDVANAPGEKIYPGELSKGISLLKQGKEIDYVGASSVELIGGGESSGNFREILIKDGKITSAGYR